MWMECRKEKGGRKMTKIRMTRMVVLMSSMWTALALALQMESDFLTVLWSHFPIQHTTTPCGTFFNCSTRKWQCGSRILPNFRCYFAEQLAALNIKDDSYGIYIPCVQWGGGLVRFLIIRNCWTLYLMSTSLSDLNVLVWNLSQGFRGF